MASWVLKFQSSAGFPGMEASLTPISGGASKKRGTAAHRIAPAAAMILGDLGAEVIHIEPPQGDDARHCQLLGGEDLLLLGRDRRGSLEESDPTASATTLTPTRKLDAVAEEHVLQGRAAFDLEGLSEGLE